MGEKSPATESMWSKTHLVKMEMNQKNGYLETKSTPSVYLSDSAYYKLLTSYQFLVLVGSVFTRTNCNSTYLCFPGLRIVCLSCLCLPGPAAVSEITIRHTLKSVFHLRRSTRCLLPFFRFHLLMGKKKLISK